MQSQHLGLPYSPSVPHLPPLKPGAIFHLVTIKQSLEPILLWRLSNGENYFSMIFAGPGTAPHSSPGQDCPGQVGLGLGLHKFPFLIIIVQLLIILITSSWSYSGRANNSIDINNDYNHLQDVPTTFSNEKPGQPNPWKYGQSFQVRWSNKFTTSPWPNLLSRCSDHRSVLENSEDNLQLKEEISSCRHWTLLNIEHFAEKTKTLN